MSDGEDCKEIEDVFISINEINNEILRNKTIATWEMAMSKYNWTFPDLYRMPASLKLLDFDINLIEHVRGVTSVAIEIADVYDEFYSLEDQSLNRDHIISGSLLHDVGKLAEYSKNGNEWRQSKMGKCVRHPFSGVALCEDQEIPPAVQQIVALHSREGDSTTRSPESLIVHYADLVNFDPLRTLNF